MLEKTQKIEKSITSDKETKKLHIAEQTGKWKGVFLFRTLDTAYSIFEYQSRCTDKIQVWY